MAEILNLNKNVPVKPQTETPAQEEALAHRHMEHEAMEGAKRASERMKNNEAGNDVISK